MVESSVRAGDLGGFLVAAVLKTLESSAGLKTYRGPELPSFLLPESSSVQATWDHEVFDGAPWLKIGEHRWEAWSSDVVMVVYERVEAYKTQDPLALDLWLRALGGESQNYWEMQSLCHSRQVMASLVERGGNPLRALKLRW